MSGFDMFSSQTNDYNNYNQYSENQNDQNDPMNRMNLMNAWEWKTIIDPKLNPTQNQAANLLQGPALVLAGAGTGKTRTIVHRVKNMIDNGVKQENILLLTFTKKAATEMTDRLKFMLKTNDLAITSGTFHSVAYKLIRTNLPGQIQRYSILDESESRAVIKERMKDLFNKVNGQFTPANVKKVISQASNTGCDIKKAMATLRIQKVNEYNTEFLRTVESYREQKKLHGQMDFDDILLDFLNKLRDDEEFRNRVKGMFDFIMVDEYQDTNQVQNQILHHMMHGKTIAESNIMVVGDDAQSIQQFRGADHKNILNFSQEFGQDCSHKWSTMYTIDDSRLEFDFNSKNSMADTKCKIEICELCKMKIIYLVENYRSNGNILKVANKTIEVMRDKFEKELQTKISSRNKPQQAEFSKQCHQQIFICDKIESISKDNAKGKTKLHLSDFAILSRTVRAIKHLEKLLINRKIPQVTYGGRRLLDSPIFKNYHAMLRIIVKIDDFEAYKNILKVVKGVGEKTAGNFVDDLVKNFNKIHKDSFEEYNSSVRSVQFNIINDNKQKKIKQFVQTLWAYNLQYFKKTVEFDTLSLIEELGKILKSFMDDNQKDKQIKDKNALIDDIVATQAHDPSQSLDDIVASILDMSAKDSDANTKDKVIISTIHSAKGLEWKTVFLLDCNERNFRARTNNADEDDDFDGEFNINNEEEKRLFQVAVTRAKERLFLLNGWWSERPNYWEEPVIYKNFVSFIGNKTIKDITEVLNTKLEQNKIYQQNEELYDKIFSKENNSNEEQEEIFKLDQEKFEQLITNTNNKTMKKVSDMTTNDDLEIYGEQLFNNHSKNNKGCELITASELAKKQQKNQTIEKRKRVVATTQDRMDDIMIHQDRDRKLEKVQRMVEDDAYQEPKPIAINDFFKKKPINIESIQNNKINNNNNENNNNNNNSIITVFNDNKNKNDTISDNNKNFSNKRNNFNEFLQDHNIAPNLNKSFSSLTDVFKSKKIFDNEVVNKTKTNCELMKKNSLKINATKSLIIDSQSDHNSKLSRTNISPNVINNNKFKKSKQNTIKLD